MRIPWKEVPSGVGILFNGNYAIKAMDGEIIIPRIQAKFTIDENEIVELVDNSESSEFIKLIKGQNNEKNN